MFRRFASTKAYDATMSMLKQDLKRAMLNKKTVEKNTVKSVLSAIKDSEIDGLKQDEFAVYRTLTKMHKQRSQLAHEYATQNRPDLADTENAEAAIISRYLQLLPVASPEEVQERLRQFLAELQARQGDVPMKQVFGLVSEKAGEWGTSEELAKPYVPKLYKEIWSKN